MIQSMPAPDTPLSSDKLLATVSTLCPDMRDCADMRDAALWAEMCEAADKWETAEAAAQAQAE